MKPISLYVEEPRYPELKALANARGRPVADLLREAMADYLARARGDRTMSDLYALRYTVLSGRPLRDALLALLRHLSTQALRAHPERDRRKGRRRLGILPVTA